MKERAVRFRRQFHFCFAFLSGYIASKRVLHTAYVVSGRSAPGGPQQNSTDLIIEDWKQINWLPRRTDPDAFT